MSHPDSPPRAGKTNIRIDRTGNHILGGNGIRFQWGEVARSCEGEVRRKGNEALAVGKTAGICDEVGLQRGHDQLTVNVRGKERIGLSAQGEKRRNKRKMRCKIYYLRHATSVTRQK